MNPRKTDSSRFGDKDGDTNMNALDTTSYETVLNTIRKWPPNRHSALVQDVLDTLASQPPTRHRKGKALEKALGSTSYEPAGPVRCAS